MSQVQEINQRLQDLAQKEEVEFKAMNVAGLRKVLSSIRITEITREGKVISANSARKGELIATILEAVAPFKALQVVAPEADYQALAKAEQMADDDYELGRSVMGDLAVEYFKLLEKYTLDQWDVENQCWKAPNGYPETLANQFVDRLTRAVDNLNTRINQRGRFSGLFKEMVEQVNAHHASQLNTYARSFLTQVYLASQTWAKDRSKQSKTNRDARSKSVDEVSITEILQHSYDVLSGLGEEIKPGYWKEVVLSLALVTGRRTTSELLTTAEFTQVDDYKVTFKGQAKSKKKRGDSIEMEDRDAYEIPTLVPAKYCVSAIDWLKRAGVRADLTKYDGDLVKVREFAHNRYSKELSKHTKKWAGCYLDTEVATLKPEKMTVHKFRQLYAQACKELYCPDGWTDDVYMAQILGHTPGDLDTINSYKADFKLVQDSLFQITE